MSSPESEIDLKRKRRLESVEEKPNLKLLKLDSAEVDAANYKECTKLFDNPEDVVQGWFILAFIFLFTSLLYFTSQFIYDRFYILLGKSGTRYFAAL